MAMIAVQRIPLIVREYQNAAQTGFGKVLGDSERAFDYPVHCKALKTANAQHPRKSILDLYDVLLLATFYQRLSLPVIGAFPQQFTHPYELEGFHNISNGEVVDHTER